MTHSFSDEEWRDVPGHEGVYQVSSLGRVKAVARLVRRKNQWGVFYNMNSPERILKFTWTHNRPMVGIYKNGQMKKTLVHSLVLLAFVGPCPPGMECCHFPDRDPCNNRLENLRWGTRKENSLDRSKHGSLIGEKHGMARLTELQVRHWRKVHQSGRSMKSISIRLGMNYSATRSMLIGETWKHIPVTQ